MNTTIFVLSRAKIRKIVISYPCIPHVCYIKVGYDGVYIAQTCFPDDSTFNPWATFCQVACDVTSTLALLRILGTLEVSTIAATIFSLFAIK